MGILDVFRNRNNSKKQSNLLDEIISKIESIYQTDEKDRNELVNLITGIMQHIRTGQLTICDKDESIANIVKKLEEMYKDNEAVLLAIRYYEESVAIIDLNMELSYATKGKKTIESIRSIMQGVIEKYHITPSKKIVGISLKEEFDIIEELVREYAESIQKSGIVLDYYINDIFSAFLEQARERIINERNKEEQERLYQEYVREWLEGEYSLEDPIVQMFEKQNLRKQKRRFDSKRRLQELGIDTGERTVLFYDGTEENGKEVEEENYNRARERVDVHIVTEEFVVKRKATLSDLVLVRTTKNLPIEGIAERTGFYSEVKFDYSLFKKELEEDGLDPAMFEYGYLLRRNTVHWTLNCLVTNHMQGSFSGREFIIVEPLEEQINNPALININESDSYFNQDVVLSDKAVIMIRLDTYQKLIQNPEIKAKLDKLNIAVFTGDEKVAVHMLLQDMGYIYGEINQAMFVPGNDEVDTFCTDIRRVIAEKVEEFQSQGRKISRGQHSGTREEQESSVDAMRLIDASEDEFLDFLIKETEINFSKAFFLAFKKEKERHPEAQKKDVNDWDNSNEPEGLPLLTPREILDMIGPEKLLEITRKYNEMIYQRHLEARRKKDQEIEEMKRKKQESKDVPEEH